LVVAFFVLFFYFVFFFSFSSKDEFIIECPRIGELTKICVAHNNKGMAPGWFLDRIFVEDCDEHRIYEFPCEKWLATNEGDGQISRFLFPTNITNGNSRDMPGN
jgi:lipoxygenase homology domain-containing protein 1